MSSSTRNVPSSSRIRSTPATWMRTPLGGLMPGRLAVEVGAGHHDPARHHAVGEHLAGAVDVGEERLQRPDPLRRHRLRPRCHSAAAMMRGTMSSGNGPLHALERERDALVEEGAGEHVGPDAELGAGQRLQRGVQRLVRSRVACPARRTSRPSPGRGGSPRTDPPWWHATPKSLHAGNTSARMAVLATRQRRAAGTGPADGPVTARHAGNGGPDVAGPHTTTVRPAGLRARARKPEIMLSPKWAPTWRSWKLSLRVGGSGGKAWRTLWGW